MTSESKPSLKLNCETFLREIIQAAMMFYEKWTNLGTDACLLTDLKSTHSLLNLLWLRPFWSYLAGKLCAHLSSSISAPTECLIWWSVIINQRKKVLINFMTWLIFVLHNSTAVLMAPVNKMGHTNGCHVLLRERDQLYLVIDHTPMPLLLD